MSYLQSFGAGEIHKERGFYFFVTTDDKVGPFNSVNELCKSKKVKSAARPTTKKPVDNQQES